MVPDFVRGCIAPVFTACHEDGRLDDEGQRALLDFLVETKSVSAYFVRCGMGQMFSFDYDDVRQIARTSCTHLAGRGAVLVGTTGIWDRNRDQRPDPEVFVRQAVELSRYAEEVGAAGVVHTLPEAIAPRDGQSCHDVVLDYFEKICEAVQGPVFIYQSPGTDERYCVTIDLVRKLADMPKVMGMKLSSNDARNIFDISYAVRDKDFGFISGAETAFLAGLMSGSRAVIGQGATVNPQILCAIQTRYEAGDLEGAMEAQCSTNMLVERSKNAIEFFKRYLAEKGYKIQPYDRGAGNPYQKQREALTSEDYEAFKGILEAELAKYVA